MTRKKREHPRLTRWAWRVARALGDTDYIDIVAMRGKK